METMYLSIGIHEKWTENQTKPAERLLREIRECSEAEYWEIRSQYANRIGKYAMVNPALDFCHHITEKMAKHQMQFL